MNWRTEAWQSTITQGTREPTEPTETTIDPLLPSNRADLHLHTVASDGLATVEQVLTQVTMAGQLRVVAITDHDRMLAPVHARQLERDFGIGVIVGEEVSTQDGHLLALFIDTQLPAGRPAAETIAAVHAQGGLCIAPHPYDWLVSSLGKAGLRRRCVPRSGAADGRDWAFDAMETVNTGITWPGWVGNAMAQHVADDLGLPGTGGSDAHTLATIGQGYTRFPGTTTDDLYRAIKQGTVTAHGRPWSAAQFLEFYHLTLRQRSLGGALTLALSHITLLP
jgi:predicted metal-dependent phosphoesterase TrpH